MSNPWQSYSMAEYLKRQVDALRCSSYGLSYLDDALNGIRPTDLVIVGARTGAGKTEFSTNLALFNAQAEKRVTLFALEAESLEIVRRIKYRFLSDEFFKNRDVLPKEISLNYTDWLFDKYKKYGEMEILEFKANELTEAAIVNLKIITPEIVGFTKQDFVTVYEEYVEDSDLIILDHIHYLASDEREGEFDHIKKTMWRLREMINKHEVPIVAMSHLRKEDRNDDSVIHGLEELHGSSEISKQANHVIGFAPAYSIPSKDDEDESFEAPVGATFCKILKTRSGHHGAERYAALLRFDLIKKQYEANYVPYRINKGRTKISPLKYEDFERWMGLGREARA